MLILQHLPLEWVGGAWQWLLKLLVCWRLVHVLCRMIAPKMDVCSGPRYWGRVAEWGDSPLVCSVMEADRAPWVAWGRCPPLVCWVWETTLAAVEAKHVVSDLVCGGS